MTVVGIDCGLQGAFVHYDPTTKRIVQADDMPTLRVSVSGTKRLRERVDPIALADLFGMWRMMGVELVIIEAVGGRPMQSAGAGFTFGYIYGLVNMGVVQSGMAFELVTPQKWKAVMAIPGKYKQGGKIQGADQLIIARADQLFPEDRGVWRGIRGGMRVDRAEAACLAKYGGDYRLSK